MIQNIIVSFWFECVGDNFILQPIMIEAKRTDSIDTSIVDKLRVLLGCSRGISDRLEDSTGAVAPRAGEGARMDYVSECRLAKGCVGKNGAREDGTREIGAVEATPGEACV